MSDKKIMEKIIITLLFGCVLFISPACGGDDNYDSGDIIIPTGMEVIKEGDVNVVVPKGGHVRKQGSVMLIETADEYASRKFADTDDRFKKMEKELKAQQKQIEDLIAAAKKP